MKINFPTEQESDAMKAEFFKRMKKVRLEREAALHPAETGLTELVKACKSDCGQAYKIRALLFSLWNGKATSLLEVVDLDWELRKHFAAVVLAFGHNDFFYDAIRSAFKNENRWDWFLEEVDVK
ncbi:MAG TPA: hypothetical protein VGO57_02415 [Verrucomicrobiae bacterium]